MIENQKGLVKHLPEELCLHIFSYLDCQGQLKSERVCKEWHLIQKKYQEILDKSWELKWFEDYPEDSVKDQLSWRVKCLNKNRWIHDNSIVYYLNVCAHSGSVSRINRMDDQVSREKIIESIMMIPIVGVVSVGIASYYPAFVIVPSLIIKGASSKLGSILKRDFSLIEDTAGTLLNESYKITEIISILFFSIFFIAIQIEAIKGFRLNYRYYKVESFCKKSSCNIL